MFLQMRNLLLAPFYPGVSLARRNLCVQAHYHHAFIIGLGVSCRRPHEHER